MGALDPKRYPKESHKVWIYTLAHDLGIGTVEEMLERMTSRELGEWQDWYVARARLQEREAKKASTRRR